MPLWVKRLLNPAPPPPTKVAGSKGDACLIAPFVGGAPVKVWNKTPLFIWQGAVASFAVMDGNEAEGWRVSQVPAGSSSLRYGGKALLPGQTYEWMIYEGEVPTMFARFQVVSAAEAVEIDGKLEEIDRELGKGSYSKTDIALARTNFFAERGLWMDAMAEAYAGGQKTSGLVQYRGRVEKSLCSN
jgi:hypothetical protein